MELADIILSKPIEYRSGAKNNSFYVKIPLSSIHYLIPEKEKIMRKADKEGRENITADQAIIQERIDSGELTFILD